MSSRDSQGELEFDATASRAVLDGVRVGVCVTDEAGDIVFVNERFCELSAYPRDELIGRPAAGLLLAGEGNGGAPAAWAWLTDERGAVGEGSLLTKEGERRPVLLSSSNVLTEDGRRYQVVTAADLGVIRRADPGYQSLALALRQTTHGIIVTDAGGRVTWINAGAERLTGYTLAELRGHKPGDLLQGPDSDRDTIAHMGRQLAAGEGFQVELVNFTKSGQPYDLRLDCSPLRDDRGALQGFLALQTDVTERNSFEQRLERVSSQLRKMTIAVDQSPASILITDRDGTIEYVNRTLVDVSGYEREELLGENPRKLNARKLPAAVYEELWATISAGHTWRGRLINRRKDGSEYIEWASISSVADERGNPLCYVAVKENITEREEAEERLRALERYDALTGLANRAAFFEVLEQRLGELTSEHLRQALVLVDLDRFHAFNDARGHAQGDRLLQLVAHRLTQHVAPGALVARLGPDEFAILPPLQEHAEAEATNREELHWMQTVRQALLEPFPINGEPLKVSASYGVGFCDRRNAAMHSVGAGEMMRMADSALAAAKAQGGGKLHFYDSEASLRLEETFRLEQDLAQAVERGELRLAIQAQVATDGTLTGAEALLRWRHGTLGDISPGRFIPLAEDSGHIVPIGRWVLEQALVLLRRLQQLDPSVTLSVNVSALQVADDGFLGELQALLAGSGVEPSGLVLEITESVFMATPALAAERLGALRGLGVGIAIDDFGTGYSSLSYLKQLPITELKIDQSFVAGLPGTRPTPRWSVASRPSRRCSGCASPPRAWRRRRRRPGSPA